MAVRFDASTEFYTRTLSLGSTTQMSVTCWMKMVVDLGSYATAWCVDNGTTDYMLLGTILGGGAWKDVTVFQEISTPAVGLRTLTLDTWYYFGVTLNGSSVTVVSRGASDTTFSTDTQTGFTATTLTTLRLGESMFGGEWLNGSLASVKVWTGAALTQAELEAEAFRYLPARTANLRAWYPLLKPETVDYGGNGLTLSGGSGASVDDGPPVSWGPRRTAIVLPASTGTPISLADSATAADSLAADADTPAADSATAADTLTVAATAALADAAVADEQMTVAVTVDLADAATADDAAIVGNPVSLADTATADDAWTTIPTPVLDEQAAGDDTLTISAIADFSDAATATDQITVAQTLPKDLADSATASDSLTVVLLQDITVTATGARRGWAAGQPGDGWDGGDLARSWTSSPVERSWPEGEPARGWSARPPTT